MYVNQDEDDHQSLGSKKRAIKVCLFFTYKLGLIVCLICEVHMLKENSKQ